MGGPLVRALLALSLLVAGCDDARPADLCSPSPDVLGEPAPFAVSARYVIHISVDGLRPDALDAAPAPAFQRLRADGAGTDNARSDVDSRYTLPNHAAQLTGRGVAGPLGHNWTINDDPGAGLTLHVNKGRYVASVFDGVHDAGLSTAAYVSKPKFSLFDDSYDADSGAPDAAGGDDGRDKIDTFVYRSDTDALVDDVVAGLATAPAAYTFVHLRDPDVAGHAAGWDPTPGSAYLDAVARADALVGRILDAVEADPSTAARTVVVLTSDHGGAAREHSAVLPANYTVPFYVWGAGIAPADLYALNLVRADPGTANVGYDAAEQPVRNGDAGNLARALLGLGAIDGSTIGVAAPLRVTASATGVDAPAPGCTP